MGEIDEAGSEVAAGAETGVAAGGWGMGDGPCGALKRLLGGGEGVDLPAASSSTALLSTLPSKFLQSVHLQFSEHSIFAWKHSQYFFKQLDLRQWQPLLCLPILASDPV